MKIKILLLAVVANIFFLYAFSVRQTDDYSLTVEVEGLRNSKGIVQFALYNTEGSIPDERFKKYFKIGRSEIVDGRSVFTFKGLAAGTYAVNILHDENENGKVDKGLILPREGIGFSNYQSIGLRNKPNFRKASFELNRNMVINVKVIYNKSGYPEREAAFVIKFSSTLEDISHS